MEIQSAKFLRGIKGTDPILGSDLPQVAFVGRSNVGKSSVMNALLNRRDLVTVGKKPGKTVEVNFFLVNEKCYFVDLPGYGYARVGVKEQDKIRKLILWYLTSGEARPALVVLVTDIKVGLSDFDHEMLQILREVGHPYIIVANKADSLNQKEGAEKLLQMRDEANEAEVFPHSAKTKKGTDALRTKIFRIARLSTG